MGVYKVMKNDLKIHQNLATHKFFIVMSLQILQNVSFNNSRSCQYLKTRTIAPKTIRLQLLGQRSILA